MSVLSRWVNNYYLTDDARHNIRESILAKPDIRYMVLDNFFNENVLQQLVSEHKRYEFSEAYDRYGAKGETLPYDSAVVFAQPNQHFGSELFYNEGWHDFIAGLFSKKIQDPGVEVKLRYHRPEADGFWIHTDSGLRDIVVIAYFNKGWKAADGGLLQLWRVDEAISYSSFKVEAPHGRMDFLSKHKRIHTSTPGGGFPDSKPHDLVLVDQIVPVYNRVFMCDLMHSPAYHSVSPSNGKTRLGFVQWLYDKRKRNG